MPAPQNQDPKDAEAVENSQWGSGPVNAPLPLRIMENGILVYEGLLSDSLELGRQRIGEPGCYNLHPVAGDSSPRLIIANTEEATISRRHLTLRRLPRGVVFVSNHSDLAIPVQSGGAVLSQKTLAVDTPAALSVGTRVILVGIGTSAGNQDVPDLAHETLSLASRDVLAAQLKRPPTLSAEQIGELHNARKTLLRQLRLRFGELPAETAAVLSACEDLGKFDLWLARFATAQSLADIGITAS